MSLVVLAALFLCLSCHGTEGGRKFSMELQTHQKIQFKNSKDYDCVDINKQPAFDHPLLKNHKIQLAPSSLPKIKNNSRLNFKNYHNFESKDEGCPAGMVPIQRAKVKGQTTDIHPLTFSEPGKHFAAVQPGLASRVYGANARIGLDNPPVKLDQISAATIWIENGEGAQLNSLQVGWAVHPRIYGDNLTRLTGYWTSDASQKTGCYDVVCPGFVQVHPKFYIGQQYLNIAPGDTTHIFVHRDKHSGHWWLVLEDNIQIGYWPSQLLPQFKDGALFLRFGGWTFNSPDGLSPPMGSGHFPNNNLKESSFFANLAYLDNLGALNDIDEPKKFADNAQCYDAFYWGNQHGSLGQTFTYGGPGGNCGI